MAQSLWAWWRRKRGLPVGAAAAFVLAAAVPVSAQYLGTRSYANRPSLSPPSKKLTNEFGRVGSRLGGNYAGTPGRSPGNVAMTTIGGDLPQTGFSGSRAGAARQQGQVGYQPSSARLLAGGRGGSQLTAQASWLRYARPGTLLQRVQNTAFLGASPTGARWQGAFDRDTTRLGSWGAPELLARRAQAESQLDLPPVGEASSAVESTPAPRLTMEQVIKNRLDSRGEMYEARAREAFKAGRYQEAVSLLSLADTTALGDPKRRIPLKLALVYAHMAAREFSESLNALFWVLGEVGEDGIGDAAAVFNRFRDVRGTLYADPGDYAAHAELADRFAVSQLRDPTFRALRAMAAWGRGDVNRAIPVARELAEEVRSPIAELGAQAAAAKQEAETARSRVDEARRLLREAQDPDVAQAQVTAAREAMDVSLNAGVRESKIREQERKLQPWARLQVIMEQAAQAGLPVETEGSSSPTETGTVPSESPVPVSP